eukprot:scaffold10321_cov69-Cyclotella_meneghiniana.AAC.4
MLSALDMIDDSAYSRPCPQSRKCRKRRRRQKRSLQCNSRTEKLDRSPRALAARAPVTPQKTPSYPTTATTSHNATDLDRLNVSCRVPNKLFSQNLITQISGNSKRNN